MEYPLIPQRLLNLKIISVLIPVVMEYPLTSFELVVDRSDCKVLIPVVMEYPLTI